MGRLRVILIWLSGIVASFLIGTGIALLLIPKAYPGDASWGGVAGVAAFTCLRLWIGDGSRPHDTDTDPNSQRQPQSADSFIDYGNGRTLIVYLASFIGAVGGIIVLVWVYLPWEWYLERVRQQSALLNNLIGEPYGSLTVTLWQMLMFPGADRGTIGLECTKRQVDLRGSPLFEQLKTNTSKHKVTAE